MNSKSGGDLLNKIKDQVSKAKVQQKYLKNTQINKQVSNSDLSATTHLQRGFSLDDHKDYASTLKQSYTIPSKNVSFQSTQPKIRSKSYNSNSHYALKDMQSTMREMENKQEAKSNKVKATDQREYDDVEYEKKRNKQDHKKIEGVQVDQRQNWQYKGNANMYLKVTDMLASDRISRQDENNNNKRKNNYPSNLTSNKHSTSYERQSESQQQLNLKAQEEDEYSKNEVNNPQQINEMVQIIDACIKEAQSTISSLENELHMCQDENLELQSVIITQEEEAEELSQLIQEKEEERQKLLKLQEISAEKNKVNTKIHNNNTNNLTHSGQNQELSYLLKVIESLNEENKQLRQQNEYLQQENSKAIDIARAAKNTKLFNEINNKIELPSPLFRDSDKKGTPSNGLNDTFLKAKSPSLTNSNTKIPSNRNHHKGGDFASNNVSYNNTFQNGIFSSQTNNLQNLSQIQHYNASLNNSTNEILKKFSLNDSTSSSHSFQLSQSSNPLPNNSKKNFKYLKPKQ